MRFSMVDLGEDGNRRRLTGQIRLSNVRREEARTEEFQLIIVFRNTIVDARIHLRALIAIDS